MSTITKEEENRYPKRFRMRIPRGKLHPSGRDDEWMYGCYFPQTDIVVSEMGSRHKGIPRNSTIEWIDEIFCDDDTITAIDFSSGRDKG